MSCDMHFEVSISISFTGEDSLAGGPVRVLEAADDGVELHMAVLPGALDSPGCTLLVAAGLLGFGLPAFLDWQGIDVADSFQLAFRQLIGSRIVSTSLAYFPYVPVLDCRC